MEIKVKQRFKDKETGKKFEIGDVIKVSVSRGKRLVKLGFAIEMEKKEKKPKKSKKEK